MTAPAQLAHSREAFAFTVPAPYAEVFPLFGAHEERKWATGFDPNFLYPVPAHDRQGTVFTTLQDGYERLWVNTCFDAAAGDVRYVYWIPSLMTAFIEIHVAASAANETRVEVVYERTATSAEANDLVLRMAEADANSGPRWAAMIGDYLQNAVVGR